MSEDIAQAPFLESQVPSKPVDPEPADMARLRRMVENAWSLTDEARLRRKEERKMYDGDQLSPSTLKKLRKRGQPPVIENLIRPAINGLLGVLEASRTDPQAYPRNADDQEAADVATKALRFAAEEGNFEKAKESAAKEYFIQSTGCILIEGEPNGPVTYTEIAYKEFVYDPHSRRLDFADAKYLGTGKWFYGDDIKRLYPKEWEKLGDPYEVGAMAGFSSVTEDRPHDVAKWVDRKNRRLFVVELYYREGGEWQRVVYCAAGVFEQGKSAYLDDKGRTVCPFIAVTYDMDQDNERYGHVKDMVSLNHEVNSRRSRLLHLNSTRQVQQSDLNAAPINAETARAEASKPDGVIPAGWQIVPTADVASGQALLLTDSRTSLQRMGPTPAVLGRQEAASQSGRARQVLQQAGLTELAPALGGIEDLETRCYRHTWFRMRQFWTAPKWIRVTDNVRAPEFIQVNEPVMGQVMQPDPSQPAMHPVTGEHMTDDGGQPLYNLAPQQGVVDHKNKLAELDLDIIIGTTPDQQTLEAETFQEIVKLTGGNIQTVFAPEFEAMLEIAPLSNKSEVLEKLRKLREEREQQIIPQLQQQIAQLQQQLQAKAAVGEADAAVKGAQAQHHLAQAGHIAAETDLTHVETARMMMEPIGTPQQGA